MQKAIEVAVIGAGPVGLTLALHAAQALPLARIAVFDSRAAGLEVGSDPRTLALSFGSAQLLQRVQAWPADAAEPILEVHVSQVPAPSGPLGEPEVRIRAAEEKVPMLGAVVAYGPLVAGLERAWAAAVAADPGRLSSRFGTTVSAIKPLAGGVEIDAGIAERFDLAVVAEGGAFGEQERKLVNRAYGQTAWVGTVEVEGAAPGVAYERFTREGPLALLPLRSPAGGPRRAALVWCVPSDDDPVPALTDTQRVAVLNSRLPAAAGRVVALGPLKPFALGLNAERTLVQGRRVRIGNAAQTLHPVAGQGLNLGLRDAFELVAALRGSDDVDAALRRVEWRRAPDRWTMMATTDFLARSFTWRAPGVGVARALALAALQAAAPLKRRLARQMMFGQR